MKKKTTKIEQPLQDIPMYLPLTLGAAQASSDLTKSFSLLNSAIHVWSDLTEDEKKRFITIVKEWVEAVDE